MSEDVVLTKEGLEKLKEELSYLKNTKRKEVAQNIKEAKEYGDITENAEYDDAKTEQAFVEGRIAELEKMIKNVRVISKSAHCQKVVLGCTVSISSDGEAVRYTIVGSSESDPAEGKISDESPLGKALIGKAIGEVFDLELPQGNIQYRVVSIE